MFSASPRSIRPRSICCSSASSPRSGWSRPISMSTSSTRGAERGCSICPPATAPPPPATTPPVTHYPPRSPIRDVGKALGLTEDVTAALADTVWGSWGSGLNDMQVKQAGLDPQNAMVELAVELATELIEFPRHLSQHVGGYVLTQDRLDTYVPIGNAAMDDRTFIEWDKDDVDALSMMKVDVLALGMLTCIRKCFDLIDDHKGERWTLATVPQDDGNLYDMLCRGESLGVFQVES